MIKTRKKSIRFSSAGRSIFRPEIRGQYLNIFLFKRIDQNGCGVAIKLLLVFFLLTGCIGDKENTDTPDLDSIEIFPEVVFSVVDDEPLKFFIESRGVVEPVQRIQITPRVSGFITAHAIQDGRVIEEGDVLLRINEEEWDYRVQEAYNQYQKAKVLYDIEIKLRGDSITDAEIEGHRITTGLADAELAYERAKLDLSYATITAPFSGIVSTKEVITNGGYIAAGMELGTLINTQKVRIRLDVLESEIVSLSEGMNIELEDPAGQVYEGVLVAVSPEINQETKTGQVIAEVENESKTLKTGMTVEARISVQSVIGKVRMPREALLERDGRTLIFKLNSGEAEWIYVTPDAMTTDWVIINHPEIFPGDTLAVDKHFSISHQQRVIPVFSINRD